MSTGSYVYLRFSSLCICYVYQQACNRINPGEYVGLIYQDRLRTIEDKLKVEHVFAEVFGSGFDFYKPSLILRVTSSHLQVGHSFLHRRNESTGSRVCGRRPKLLHRCLGAQESLMTCVDMGWMAILVSL